MANRLKMPNGGRDTTRRFIQETRDNSLALSTQAGQTLAAAPKIWVGEQEDYDALTPNANTVYVILEAE